MLYIYNYLALYTDNNVNNMTFVRPYCLFLVLVVKFSSERSEPKINNMPSKSHVIPLRSIYSTTD